jgi:hypothetical protein
MEASYEEGKQPESVNVAIGPKIGKEVIKLLTASSGKG